MMRLIPSRRSLGLLSLAIIVLTLTLTIQQHAVSAQSTVATAGDSNGNGNGDDALPFPTYRRNTTLTKYEDFLKFFYFDAIPDPSGGFATYVTQSTAEQYNLIGPGQQGGIRIAADLTQKNRTAGRMSVRLRSHANFTEGLFFFKVHHGPVGCGVWPAIWMVDEEDWPSGGEIDIFEYGNGFNAASEATLHVNGTCVMPGDGQRWDQGVQTEFTDCNSYQGINQNHACPIALPSKMSAARTLNHNGGAWFVMQHTLDEVKVWFYTPCTAPADLVKHAEKITPSKLLGTPSVRFPSTTACHLRDKFKPLGVIINLSFGGYSELYWRRDSCLSVAPSAYTGWSLTDDSTEYYKQPGNSVELDVSSWAYYSLDDGIEA